MSHNNAVDDRKSPTDVREVAPNRIPNDNNTLLGRINLGIATIGGQRADDIIDIAVDGVYAADAGAGEYPGILMGVADLPGRIIVGVTEELTDSVVASGVANLVILLPGPGGKLGRLEKLGRNVWRSSSGLVYKGLDRSGLNRVEHVLRHTVADSTRRAHSVFSVPRNKVLSLLDEAWAKRGVPTVHPQSGNLNYRIDLGRVVGENGETAINISVRPGTSEVVTAFPVP